MEIKTISKENIQGLYNFTRQHYVEHYDVQTELVDHLANDIEEIWNEQPLLTFDQARDKSFKKFGVYGFSNIVEQKQNQLQKKYLKLILHFVKQWFKLPKIIITTLLVFSFYKFQEVKFSYYFYVGIYSVILFYESYMMFLSKKKLKKKEQETAKKWMFEEIILKQGIGSFILVLIFMFPYFFPENKNFLTMPEILRILNAIMIVLIIIIGYITLFIIPKKAEKILEKQYPEYKIANSL